MPNYMEIPNEELIELVKVALPYEDRISFDETHGPDWIRFNWNGGRFRLSHSLVVEEFVNNVQVDTSAAMLMEALFDDVMGRLESPLDADEKHWHIECQILETEQIKAEAQLTMAKVALVEVETARIIAETTRMHAEENLIDTRDNSTSQATAKVSCGHCNAEFEFSGNDEGEIRVMVNNFVDEHANCRE